MKNLLSIAAIALALSACTTHTTQETVTTNGETVTKQTTATNVATTDPETPKTTLKNTDGQTLEYTRVQDGNSVRVLFDGKDLNLVRQSGGSGEVYAGEGGYEFAIQQTTYTLTQNGKTLFSHTQS